MLTAYFDESSTDGEYQYAVGAGFVGNTKTWMEFERLWKRAESRDAKKSRAKKSNRKNVVLAQIASGLTLLPIYVVLDKKTWDAVLRVNKKLEHAWNMPNPYSTAYGVCCYWCCALLDAWAKKVKRLPRSQRIKVVFDDGNSQKLSFDRGYRDYRAEKTNSRLASVPLYDTDDECIPLRAADLYASAMGRYVNTGKKDTVLKIIAEDRRVKPLGITLGGKDAEKVKEVMERNLAIAFEGYEMVDGKMVPVRQPE